MAKDTIITTPTMLKVVKAQKRALTKFVIFNLLIIAAIVFYLISTKLDPNVPPDFQHLFPYAIIMVIALIFNGFFTFSILKKSNYEQALKSFNSRQLTHINEQFTSRIRLFKRPIIYTDTVLFVFQGFVLRAIPINDIIWLKHQTATGFVEIVSRDKHVTKAMTQVFPPDFKKLAEQIRAQKPNIFVTDNSMAGEGAELNQLFEQDFDVMIQRSENKAESKED